MNRLQRLWPLALLAAAGLAAYVLGLNQLISFDAIVQQHSWLEARIARQPLLAAAAYMAIYVTVVGLSIPGAVFLTLAGGLFFGWKIGIPLTVIAATLGACIIFLIARTSLGALLVARQGGAISRLRQGFNEGAASYLLFLRLVPVFPFFFTNLAAAALGAPLKTFAWTTFAGIIPATAAFSIAGSGLGSVIAAQGEAVRACKAGGGLECAARFDPSMVLTPELLAGLAALGFAALLPAAARKYFGNRGQSRAVNS